MRQMNRLIGDLLTRRAAGRRLRLEIRDVDVKSLFDDAIETSRPAAQQCDIELSAEAPAGYHVRADSNRLLQAIGNLLANAIKFTPSGGRVMLSAKAVNGETVFAVSDNGPGMSPEDMNHLFDRFWQARDVDSRGMGRSDDLKGIVEAHGGRIWSRANPDRAALFSLFRPRSRNRVQSIDSHLAGHTLRPMAAAGLRMVNMIASNVNQTKRRPLNRAGEPS